MEFNLKPQTNLLTLLDKLTQTYTHFSKLCQPKHITHTGDPCGGGDYMQSTVLFDEIYMLTCCRARASVYGACVAILILKKRESTSTRG